MMKTKIVLCCDVCESVLDLDGNVYKYEYKVADLWYYICDECYKKLVDGVLNKFKISMESNINNDKFSISIKLLSIKSMAIEIYITPTDNNKFAIYTDVSKEIEIVDMYSIEEYIDKVLNKVFTYGKLKDFEKDRIYRHKRLIETRDHNSFT